MLDEATLRKIAKVRRRVRRHVWSLLYVRPGGYPRPDLQFPAQITVSELIANAIRYGAAPISYV
ncbi:hypothetical protein [Streptomyces sp. NPDC000880]